MKIELRAIHKHFGPVRANDGITLSLEGGRIYGLLGENGAGKSTLMKVLSGYIQPDAGDIILNGRPAHFRHPADALGRGVGMLHQEPLDFPPLRLIENFITGRDRRWRQGRRSALAAFRQLSQQFGFDLDPEATVGDLTLGERQQLEIIRLLWLGAQALILDEPTTGITTPQKVRLFAALRQLAAEGKTIIFVSHKLEDVEDVCREVVVLRQGRVVGQVGAPLDAQRLVQLMFGQALATGERPAVPPGPPVLRLQQARFSDLRLRSNPITLDIAAGEVIGVAGLEGSGQRLLMLGCAGLARPDSGRILVGEEPFTHRAYRRYLEAGIVFMPADRMREGLIAGLTLAEHIALAQGRQVNPPKAWQRLDGAALTSQAERRIQEYNIKGQPHTPVESLSGGNQQRTLLALLPDQLRLLIMEHPTRGLDVESAQYIWGKLLKRREQGTAILFASADLDEIAHYSDRIVVCFGGEVTAILSPRAGRGDAVRLSASRSLPAPDGMPGAVEAQTLAAQLGYLIAGKTPPPLTPPAAPPLAGAAEAANASAPSPPPPTHAP